jgi:hypothetical protein
MRLYELDSSGLGYGPVDEPSCSRKMFRNSSVMSDWRQLKKSYYLRSDPSPICYKI